MHFTFIRFDIEKSNYLLMRLKRPKIFNTANNNNNNNKKIEQPIIETEPPKNLPKSPKSSSFTLYT